jgi:hypothetical protein
MVSLFIPLNDDTLSPAIGFLAGWFVMGLIGTIWLALHSTRTASQPVQDLDQLHRLIDKTREELRQDPQGARADDLRRLLAVLTDRLPEDDLRRRRELA